MIKIKKNDFRMNKNYINLIVIKNILIICQEAIKLDRL
jgi:hypothetical protein